MQATNDTSFNLRLMFRENVSIHEKCIAYTFLLKKKKINKPPFRKQHKRIVFNA